MKNRHFGGLLFFVLLQSTSVFSQCSFTVTATVTNVKCYNGTNGSITANVTGGTGPFQYQLAEAGAGAWQLGNSFPALAAGTYPVSVKDASGCIKTIYATVTQPTALTIGYSVVEPTCPGSSNGSITISPSGGTAPYGYAWTKDGSAYSSSQNLTGISKGSYFLTLTDAEGCSTSPIVTQYVKTINLSGFNEDVIAEGTNASAGSPATTNPLDQGASGNVFYVAGYSNTSGTSGSHGVPVSGTFNSQQDASRPYKFASYSANNSLLLRSSSDASYGGATSGTLTFASENQSPYATLYVIGTTGNGTGTADYQVNFEDGSSYTGSLNFPDWFLAPATASLIRAMGSLDRVSRASPYGFTGSTDFNIWEAPISIPGASQNKVVTSVSFSWGGASNARINLFGITGYTSTTAGIRVNNGPATAVSNVAITGDAPANQFCSGQAVTFTAASVNSGSTPTYQWKLNGSPAGTNSPTFTTSGLTNGSTVQVTMTAGGTNTACIAVPTVNSNTIVMTQAAKVAAVSISGSNSGCAGQAMTFTATPVNGGSPSYQWRVNGSPAGTNSPSFSSTLSSADVVSVEMTSSIGCASNNPASSNTIAVTVSPVLEPSVTISATPAVHFSSTAVAAGSSPSYQWYKNGAAIGGATSATYNTGSATVGDVYSLKMTSNYACKTAPSAMSNYLTVNFATLPVELVYFTASYSNRKVTLQWKTATEVNNRRFLVQRQSAGGAWETVAEVAASGASSGSLYSAIDVPTSDGVYQYRLAQQDNDGRITYSETRIITIRGSKIWTISDLTTQWQINSTQYVRYSLFDLQGRLLLKGEGVGTHLITKPQPKAVYVLQVDCNGIRDFQKVE